VKVMIKRISSAASEPRGATLSRLKAVCAEFEAVFLSHMLKTMRSSMSGEGGFGKSHQGEVMGSMADEKIALDMAQKRGIGLGDLLYRRLQASYSDPERQYGKENHSDD